MPYKRAKTTNFLRQYQKSTSERYKIAYLAGLIDGEGYLKVEKWGTARLVIGMTHYKTIKWCYNTFGGTLNTDGKTTTGKNFYVWRLNNKFEILKVCVLCYPFLITKQTKALQFIKSLYNEVKSLKPHKAFLTKWQKYFVRR